MLACSGPPATQEAHLGEISIEVTGLASAKPSFQEGLLLLHSFEYEDARTAFLQAQGKDAHFAMAYWGEALSYHHTLWDRQDYDAGVAALSKIKALEREGLTESLSPLEKELIAGANILYGEGSRLDRNRAYADFMAKLFKANPKNHEVASFYALALLGSVPEGRGRDYAVYEKGAKIAQGILNENPKHPGALHYLIHSYDDPDHAPMALEAANSYSKVAPDAAHALHMPSHIYVALGMWDEVVSSNIASYEASEKRMERMELGNQGRSYHALDWLMYGQLQKGNWAACEKIMQDMQSYARATPTYRARDYWVHMIGTYAVALDNWEENWMHDTLRTEDLSLPTRGIVAYIKGRKAALQKDAGGLAEAIQSLALARQAAILQKTEGGGTNCSSYAGRPANQLQIDMAEIVEMELLALQATQEGKLEEADQILKDAMALDRTLNYSFGPPEVVKPIYEAYGDWLMAQDRVEEAEKAYRECLNRTPQRRLTLLGLAKALEKQEQSGPADSLRQVVASFEAATIALQP